jgi:hypothetical protein
MRIEKDSSDGSARFQYCRVPQLQQNNVGVGAHDGRAPKGPSTENACAVIDQVHTDVTAAGQRSARVRCSQVIAFIDDAVHRVELHDARAASPKSPKLKRLACVTHCRD